MAPKKREQEIDPKEVVILADAVMIRSDALMEAGNITRAAADSLALKQVNFTRRKKGLAYIKSYVKSKGRGFIVGPSPAVTRPGSRSGEEENTGPTNKNSPRPRTTTTTTTPATTTTTVPSNTPNSSTLVPSIEGMVFPERKRFVDEWLKNRAATYEVVLGLSPAAAKAKAIEDALRTEVGTEADPGPFNVSSRFPSEAPGAAQKQYKAIINAKQRGGRWAVLGYGLYTEQEIYELRSALERGFDNGPDSEDPRINPNAGGSGGGGDGGGRGGGGGRAPKDYGNKKPASAVSGDTYTNSKNVKFTYQDNKWVRTATLGTSGTTVVIDGKTVTVGSQQWKTIIQEEFGSMWDVYNSDQEVKQVIDESVRLGYFDDETKMTAKLQNTTWFRTTQQSARQFAIQQSTDPATSEARITASVEELRANAGSLGFTLNDTTLRKLASDSLKFGWSPQQTLNALGSEQVAQAQLGGPQGMADLRQSSTGRNLRAKAATYFQKPSEELIGTWTQQILTGQKTEVQWDELMRSSARTQFRSLQPALDRGEDVDTAMYAYKQQAAATLGSSIDVSQIDWTQDKWNKALNYRDPKTNDYRQMDLWEWNTYLRSLPEWQNTDEAKNAYGNLAQSLARGFGKMA
jgi:hypothetical protein